MSETDDALVFATASRDKAIAFCRELVARGLTRETVSRCGLRLEDNTFRTSFRPATACLGPRYRVIFRDSAAGPRVPRPARDGGPKKKQPPSPCLNAATGCDRMRVYADGLCKRCHDRQEYRTNPTFRQRKLRQAREFATKQRELAKAAEARRQG